MTILEERATKAIARIPRELERLHEMIEPLALLASPPRDGDEPSRLELSIDRASGRLLIALGNMTSVLSDIRDALQELAHDGK